MAFVALTSLIKTIHIQFLHDRAGSFSFFESLCTFTALLQVQSSRNGDGDTVRKFRDLEMEIRDFALKAEDDIEHLSNFILHQHGGQKAAASHQLLLHQTLQEATKYATRLLESLKMGSATVDDDDEANQTQPSNTWLRHASAANVDSDGRMVGRHNDCRLIKDQLFSPCFDIPGIISIVGMVGIGKTTVARNVYEDPSVASYFDVRGWVTMPSQHYNMSGMLSQLLHSITPVEEPIVIKKGSTPHELAMQVRKCFSGKKYLIVLDNITIKRTWDQALNDIIGCVSN